MCAKVVMAPVYFKDLCLLVTSSPLRFLALSKLTQPSILPLSLNEYQNRQNLLGANLRDGLYSVPSRGITINDSHAFSTIRNRR